MNCNCWGSNEILYDIHHFNDTLWHKTLIGGKNELSQAVTMKHQFKIDISSDLFKSQIVWSVIISHEHFIEFSIDLYPYQWWIMGWGGFTFLVTNYLIYNIIVSFIDLFLVVSFQIWGLPNLGALERSLQILYHNPPLIHIYIHHQIVLIFPVNCLSFLLV